MNKSVPLLYQEHEVILRALSNSKKLSSLIGKQDDVYLSGMKKLIRFLREYADSYHHAKEEGILFPEMIRKNEMLGNGIIQELEEHHREFREQLTGIEQAMNENRLYDADRLLKQYSEALLDHIAVENDELFVMCTGLFSDEELKNLDGRFEDRDRELGTDEKIMLQKLAES